MNETLRWGPSSCYRIQRGSGNGTWDCFLSFSFLFLCGEEVATGPECSGAWFSPLFTRGSFLLLLLTVSKEKVYFSRNDPSSVAVILWFMCLSSSPLWPLQCSKPRVCSRAQRILSTVWRSLGPGELTIYSYQKPQVPKFTGLWHKFHVGWSLPGASSWTKKKARIAWKRTCYFFLKKPFCST